MSDLVLTIDGRRTAYSVSQILDNEHTMTVGELIDYLRDFDPDMPVMINNDNGYTYGEIDYDSFREEVVDEEEEE